MSDIAILHKHKDQLTKLLQNFDHFRNLQIKSDYQEWIRDKSGNMVKSSSLAESLAFAAYERIPSEIRSESTPSCRYGTKDGENLQLELIKISTEMERKCVEAVRKYQDYHIAAITEEINVLIGINIEKK